MNNEKIFLMYHGIMDSIQFAEFADHRESFDRKVLNGKATKEEILEQIKQESDLLKKIEDRIEKTMMGNNTWDFSSEVLVILSNRVNDLYILLFKRFDINVIIISDYINICSKNEHLNVMYKTVLDEIMNLFHSDPMMYTNVAYHAFNDCNDIVSANIYIAYGMQFHKKCKNLYIQDFCMEVKHLELLGETSIQTAIIKYRNIIQLFKNDINIHFDLVDILKKNVLFIPFESIIIRDMVQEYSAHGLMWQKLAKTNLNGFIYNFETETLEKEQNISFESYISNFFKTYNKALVMHSFKQIKIQLWSLFLDDLIEIYNSSIYQLGRDIEEFLEQMVDSTFNQAYSNNFMRKPDHFIFLANCSDKKNELAILQKGLSISKENVTLWSMLIEFYTKRCLTNEAMCILWLSYTTLKDESLPLWKMMESYVTTVNNNFVIEVFYESTRIVNIDEIDLSFRTNYLEWCFVTKDLNSVQKVFNSLKQREPKNLELYKKMIQLSSKVGNKNLKYIKSLYSEACNIFGHIDVEIWYDCMRFEYTYGIKSEVDMIFNVGLRCLENRNFKDQIAEMKKELDEQFNKPSRH